MSEKKEVKAKGIYHAIANVMKEVKSIDKNLEVGTGKSSYKGVSDKDVKHIVGESMQKNGLIILPKSYETTVNVERWVDEETWNGKTQVKQKQQVLVECKAMYELIHVDTGEKIEIPGYGHGIDAQDKAPGKATTYALKYALLYIFLIPTGSIDDADKEHSNDKTTPKAKTPPQTANATPDKPKPRQDGMLVIPTKKDIDAALFHNMPIEEVVAVFKMDNTQCDKYKQLLIEKTK